MRAKTPLQGTSVAEIQPLYLSTGLDLETELGVKSNRIALLGGQAKGATGGECPQGCMSSLEGK